MKERKGERPGEGDRGGREKTGSERGGKNDSNVSLLRFERGRGNETQRSREKWSGIKGAEGVDEILTCGHGPHRGRRRRG